MYESWAEAWNGWSRSLPLRDAVTGWRFVIGLLEVTFAQSMPLLVSLASLKRSRDLLTQLNLLLVAMRIGVLIGARRAYQQPPATYWLSPLADALVCTQLWLSAFRAEHTWRGRALVARA
jgi:dolichol-phosphate mannosyltransferase